MVIKKIELYFNRYQNREYRVTQYRKQIDKSLNNTNKLNYEKIAIKIEREIHKRTKFELKLTSKWWLLFFGVIDTKKGSSDRNKCIDDLFNETLCLPFSQNSSVALLELYALILEYGLYSIGFIIRSQSTKLVLEEGFNNKSSQNIIERYLSAAFEEGKYAELQDSLEKLIATNTDNEEFFLLDLFLNKIIFKTNNKKIFKERYIEKNYLDLISGKRVAIVGPSLDNLNNGKEIDSFDVIVRFNYKGENFSTNYYGSRTDISYFNGANTRDLEKNLGKYSLQDLKTLVFKGPFQADKFNSKCVRRMFLPLEHFMLDTSPNSLPNMLADLLLYHPQEIKVFSIDMGLSTQRDISYGTWEKHIWDRFYPKAGHDPYSQFNFVKNCYKNNLIKVDHILKEILELEISEYMEELQNTYLDKALFTTSV